MKKFFKYFLLLLAGFILAAIGYLLVTFPPIMAGMAAKTMCSCVYVMGRSPESVVEKELSVFPGLGRARIEFIDSTAVTARILWVTKKAIYRKGLGCTLLAERSEEEVRSQSIALPNPPRHTEDSLGGPGFLGAPNAGWTVYPPLRSMPSVDKVIEDAFVEDNPQKPKNTLAIVVVHQGKIIGEKYATGFDQNSKLMGWSMTKSLTNALVGVLVLEGKLKIDQEAAVPDWQKDDRGQITLNNLMQGSSGLAWSESYFLPGDFHNMFIHSDDKGGYAASKELENKPNEFFEYSSGTTNIISRIVRQTVGDSLYYRFPYEKLFYKIGMYHTLLEPDASGTFVGSSYGYASARDWARFGLLFLFDGVWNGERILPEGWVKYSTTPAPAAPRGEYGAQWWLNAGAKDNPENSKYPGLPHEAYIADGFEHQYIVVIPSRSLVVVRLGISHHGYDISGLVQKIIATLPDEGVR